jgi:hypothetical protein
MVTSLLGAGPMLVLGVVGPSYAGGGLQQCMDRSLDHNGEPPTCTNVNGTGVASWPDDGFGSSGSGIPGSIVGLLVVAVLVGVAITVWTCRPLSNWRGSRGWTRVWRPG